MTIKKMILIADLHLHHKPIWYVDQQESFLNDLAKYINSSGDGVAVCFLGDVFEIKNNIDSRVTNVFLSFLSKLKVDRVVWLTGQHDSYMPGRPSLDVSGAVFNSNSSPVTMISDKEMDVFSFMSCGVWGVPYLRDLADYRRALSNVPDGAIVLTHVTLKEALGGNWVDGKDVISLKEFDRFKLVLAGDIHVKQDYNLPYGMFHYIGSVFQRDWRDAGAEGYFGVVSSDLKLERFKTNCVKHIKVNSVDDIPSDKRRYVIKNMSNTDLKLDNDKNILNVITDIKTVDSVQLKSEDSSSNMVEEYLKNNVPPDIDRYRKAGYYYIEVVSDDA